MAFMKMIDDWFDHTAHPMAQLYIPGAPWYTSIVIVVYLVFVLRLGPKFMENKKAFDLTELIRIYNTLNIFCSAVGFLVGIYFTNFTKSCCICEDNNALLPGIYLFNHFYMFLKMCDMLDTVFFVLRKKNNQISFLHVSHHAFMPLASWLVIEYAPDARSGLVPILNPFVNVIMYTYYYKTSQGSQLNWIKKHITRIQIAQFVIISIHSARLILTPSCEYLGDYPKWLSYLLLAHGLFFLFIFSKYYRQAYSEKPKSISNEGNKRNTVNGNVGRSTRLIAVTYN